VVWGPPSGFAQVTTPAPSVQGQVQSPRGTVPVTAPHLESDDEGERHERPKKRTASDHAEGWAYASRGLQFRSADGRWFQWVSVRNQFRGTSEEGEGDWALNRSRLKAGGELGSSRVQHFVEVDLKTPRAYHFFVNVKARDWLQVRAGQWKVEFNRERVDSSGDQQLVDRSLINRDVTLDGQLGVMARGRVRRGHPIDGEYFLGVLAGEGRLSLGDGDGVPMLLGRYQWNVFGRSVGFSQGDVEYHAAPAMAIGIAAVRNRGRFTSFGSDGGSQLSGFETGGPGRYDLRQWMADVAFFNRGFSLQAEQHWKDVRDREQWAERRLVGGYLLAGYFPHHRWRVVPAALEVAGRLAYEDPNRGAAVPTDHEVTGGINWYVNQHRNKINVDVSRLSIGGRARGRVRVQWDISL
jgi:phosphate-selective porin OprO and OprP